MSTYALPDGDLDVLNERFTRCTVKRAEDERALTAARPRSKPRDRKGVHQTGLLAGGQRRGGGNP
jgi:hypothetical protein